MVTGRGSATHDMNDDPPAPPSAAGTLQQEALARGHVAQADGMVSVVSNGCGSSWSEPAPTCNVGPSWASMNHQGPPAAPQAPMRAMPFVHPAHPSVMMQGQGQAHVLGQLHPYPYPPYPYYESLHQPLHYPPPPFHPSQHVQPAWQWMPQYVGPPQESPHSLPAMHYDDSAWQHWPQPPPQHQAWMPNAPTSAPFPPRAETETFVSRTQRRRRQREALAVKLSILHHAQRKASAGAGPEQAAPQLDPQASASS